MSKPKSKSIRPSKRKQPGQSIPPMISEKAFDKRIAYENGKGIYINLMLFTAEARKNA